MTMPWQRRRAGEASPAGTPAAQLRPPLVEAPRGWGPVDASLRPQGPFGRAPLRPAVHLLPLRTIQHLPPALARVLPGRSLAQSWPAGSYCSVAIQGVAHGELPGHR